MQPQINFAQFPRPRGLALPLAPSYLVMKPLLLIQESPHPHCHL